RRREIKRGIKRMREIRSGIVEGFENILRDENIARIPARNIKQNEKNNERSRNFPEHGLCDAKKFYFDSILIFVTARDLAPKEENKHGAHGKEQKVRLQVVEEAHECRHFEYQDAKSPAETFRKENLESR